MSVAAVTAAPSCIYERPLLYPKQRDAIFHDARVGCVEASTKSGKTHGCLIWLTEQAMQGRAGRNYWWVAPIFAQTEIAYRRLKRALPREVYSSHDTRHTITLGNGAIIWFKSAEKPDSLYGEDVYAVVIDEASRVREDSWYAVRTTLTATRGPVRMIGNVKGTQNWFYRLARRAESGEPDMHYARITAYDAVEAGVLVDKEIEEARRELPDEVFRELYLTEPAGDAARKVLPWDMAQACVDAWEKVEDRSGMLHVGLDVADTGADHNAMVARRGPAIVHAESWTGGTLGDTTRRADTYCREHGASRLYYDVGGVGAGVRSHLAEMGHRPYSAQAVQFGGKVEGADNEYSRGVTNRDFFSRRNAQLAWALRLRAQRTLRLLGEKEKAPPDPAACLAIDPSIPKLNVFLSQLSQPEWKENTSGKIVIDKAPDDMPSPDLYDASVMAFTHDSRYGVKHG